MSEPGESCPRCGYGPITVYRNQRRTKCPACFLRLPRPEPKPAK